MSASATAATLDIRHITVRTHSWQDWPDVAPLWADLFESGRFSIFLSPTWVDTWMAVFGASLRPTILLFTQGEDVQGACLLVETKSGFGPFTIRRASLNACGEAASEATYPEFNDLLCREGAQTVVAKSLAGFLARRSWDELVLNGFEPGTGYDALRAEFPDLRWDMEIKPSHYVDLGVVRHAQQDFECGLGRTTRKHLRQNRRHYSESGPLILQEAESLDTAIAFFDEMSALNRYRREENGSTSVFAAERFTDFHHRLIRRCLHDGSARLTRLSSGGRTLGILYVLEQNGKVYFYQCGFAFDDTRWSPGTLTLGEYIQHCLTSGLNEFDFLAGGEQYKERLSTGSRNLIWASGRRSGAKMRGIEALRAAGRNARINWRGHNNHE
jgi:CelD/BcsL family acetyltransferase involved in cellulose biosynthesis